MAIGAVLQALAAGASGAGRGIGEFQDRFAHHETVLADERYRDDLTEDRERERALQRRRDLSTRNYQEAQLAQGEVRLDTEATRAETARIQAETGAARERRLSATDRGSDNPVKEAATARVKRALSALDSMNPEMTDSELDRVARMRGFAGGFDEAVAAARRTKMGEWQPTPRAERSMLRSRAESGYDVPQLSGIQPAREPQRTVDVADLPVGVQQAIAGAESTRGALNRYRSEVETYMQRGRVSRGLGAAGVPSEDRDRSVGRLESMQKDVQINAKELANLGVLNGPDMEILNDLVGDPLSTTSIVRDPSYTLSKLDAADEFIRGRVDAYESLYGRVERGGAASETSGSRWDDLARGAHGPPRHPENPYRQ